MILFRRDPQAFNARVYLNGREVKGWVLADAEAGWVVSQEFPSNWLPGDPLPEEREQLGRVKIDYAVQCDV